MKTLAVLMFVATPVIAAGPPVIKETPEPEKWFFEQITQTSVDSGSFITSPTAGAPSVVVHNFPTRELCLNAKTQLATGLTFGIDIPMGTGSYFARLGAWMSDCIQRK